MYVIRRDAPVRMKKRPRRDPMLRMTWIDYPIDSSLSLFIDRVDGHLRLLLEQPEPDGATDAVGFDRELVLTFSEPVAASSVEAFLQDGMDTSG